MYKKLRRKIKDLVLYELEIASKDNGDFFHSSHEGMGVIQEEVEETIEAVARMSEEYDDFKRATYKDVRPQRTQELFTAAVDAACEAVQVAAMVIKAERSIRHE